MADFDPNIDAARCPGASYTDMLKADTRRVPDYLMMESTRDLGDAPISIDRYISPEFKRLEDTRMWPNVWQFAAREEEMPDPGDTVVYDINDRSYLIIRQQDGGVRAFHNVCLHRGRKLREKSGRAVNLRCAFHGFTWHNDGQLKEIPCAWDFKHLANKDMSLPQIRVNRWQGFIMVTENPDIPDFEAWAGPGIEPYKHWKLDECYTAIWVGRVIPANWKVVAEAFMEAWHSVTTHPQLLPFLGDANTRYDLYGDYVNRAITPSGVLSPHIKGKDQHYILDKMNEFAGGSEDNSESARRFKAASEDTRFSPDDPFYARKMLAEANRQNFNSMDGRDYSEVTDSEVLDNFTYNIFPNFSPWGGHMPQIVYRWRPWRDVDHCLMEVRILMRTPLGQPTPRAVEMHLIPEDQPFASAAHLMGKGLADVFDQDMANLPYVQAGLKASANGVMELGSYQETRIRQFQQTLDKYIDGVLP